MSRLFNKIQALKEQTSELEDALYAAELKMARQTFKRRRKAYRKKLITDPMLRIAAQIERTMFEAFDAKEPVPGHIIGLIPSTCSDCDCGKASGCR